jgi:hypothetical protein
MTEVSVSACPDRGTIGAPNLAAEGVTCPVFIGLFEVSEGGLEPAVDPSRYGACSGVARFSGLRECYRELR